MCDVAHESLDTIINTTELCTRSAFCFGSLQSSCWRYGEIPPEEAHVADAVAASAAYPILLPPLERQYEFTKGDDLVRCERVLLSDGGTFDNLGVTPLEPRRSSEITTNVVN